MSRYNIVLAEKKCPKCDCKVELTIFVYESLGHLNCFEYSIGDQIGWEIFDSIKLGGRPENGCIDVKGWTVCPDCDAELRPIVIVRDDKIVNIEFK